MLKAFTLACVCALGSVAGAHADVLTFRGTALAACALSAPVDGVITLNGDLKSWSTTVPATLAVINTAPATLTVTRPTDWASAPAGTPSTSFTTVSSTTGINVGTLTGGAAATAALNGLGATLLSVSLGATASSPFRAGLHVAEVTVTCSVP